MHSFSSSCPELQYFIANFDRFLFNLNASSTIVYVDVYITFLNLTISTCIHPRAQENSQTALRINKHAELNICEWNISFKVLCKLAFVSTYTNNELNVDLVFTWSE